MASVPKQKERYTKISHEEVHKKVSETTREEVVMVDASKAWKAQNRMMLITLRIKYIVPICYFLICFPLAIILLIRRLSIPTDDITSAVGVVMTLSFISLSNPIADIQPITGGQTCDYSTFAPTSLGFWNGTSTGCYCADTKILTSGECIILDPTIKTCQTVAARSEIDTFTWNGDRFCVRRSTDYVRTSGACPSGYTKCGLNFCVIVSDVCPITDVQILDTATATPTNYIARPLTLDKKMVFLRNYLNDPQLVQLSFSTSQPCLDKHSFTARSTGNTHPLEKQVHTGCGKYGTDNESIILDTMTENQFYTANYIMDYVEDLQYYLNATNQSTVTLTSRYRFATLQTQTCAEITMSDVTNLIPDLDNFALVYYGISISAVFISTLTTFIAIIYIRVARREELYIMDKEEPFATRFLAIINFLQMSYFVACFILGNNAFTKFSPIKSYLSTLNDNKCFTQSSINSAISDLTTFINDKTDYFIFITQIGMILGIVSVGAWTINYLYRSFKKWEGKKNY